MIESEGPARPDQRLKEAQAWIEKSKESQSPKVLASRLDFQLGGQ